MKSVIEKIEEIEKRREQGNWQVAGGGSEERFKKGCYSYTYMWQPSTGRHAYYCHETDMIVTDEQALNWL